MGQERQLVLRLQGPGGALDGFVRLALLLDHGSRAGRGRLERADHALGVERSARAFVPLDLERVARGLGAPPGVGHHGHAVRDLHHVLHARHRLGLAGVEAHRLAADHGALQEGRVEHPRQLDVDPELRAAVDLPPRVETVDGLAQVPAVLGVLQRHVLRDGQLRGGLGQRAIGRLLSARTLHCAVPRAAGGGVNAPSLRRGGDEHGARLGAGRAQLVEAFPHRGRAPGDLAAEEAVDVDLAHGRDLDLDPCQVDFQLLRHERGQRGVDALPHLGAGGHDGDGVVAADPHPGVRHRRGGLGPRGPGQAVGQHDGQHEAAAGDGRRLEEVAPGDRVEGFHDYAPFRPAAMWMAARMRG